MSRCLADVEGSGAIVELEQWTRVVSRHGPGDAKGFRTADKVAGTLKRRPVRPGNLSNRDDYGEEF
jgi:hypothetical protein